MVAHKALGVATVGVLLVGLGAAQLLPTGSSPLAPAPAQAGELVAYDSCTPLLKAFRAELARTATPYGWGTSGGPFMTMDSAARVGSAMSGSTTGGGMPVPAAAAEGAASTIAGAVGNGDTGTNLQEKGVDEPDLVKLSGGHLVTVSGGALRLVSTGATPTEIGRLALPAAPGGNRYAYDMSGSSQELLVSGDRVLVVDHGFRVTGKATPPRGESNSGSAVTTGSGQVDIAPAEPVEVLPPDAVVPPDAGGDVPVPDAPGIVAPQPYDLTTPTTVLRLADVSDPAAPRWIETYELDGSYLSARLVDGTVRLVTRSQPAPTPAAYPPNSQQSPQRMTELNRAAAQELTLTQLLPQATRRAMGTTTQTGAAVRCDDVSYAPDSTGAGLLLVTTLRPEDGLQPVDSTGIRADGELVYATADRLFVGTSRWGTAAGFARSSRASDDVTTQVHAFDTSDATALRYVGTGTVDGYVLGRWALSWHEGSLRVATTTGEPWGAGPTSSSSVVVLREAGGALAEVGRVDGLGKGEKVQAVRYLGDYATVVTFRQTDPLYVLDLGDPAAPALTGELKVPGFSTYLHPIGDDRLLGIGMEADARTGRTTGLQASVFDLSTLSKPVQVDRLQLGRGYSEALQDSRAFGYDPSRRLAVLPFQDERGGSAGLGIAVGRDGSLSLAGKLSAGTGQQGYPVGVRRVVLDGDRVHVLTGTSVVTGTSAGFTRTGALRLD